MPSLEDGNQQQVLQQIFVHAVVLIDAVLQLQAECLIELLVFLPIVLHHTLEFILNGTLDAPCDLAKLCVVLEHFSEMFRDRSSESTRPLTKLK